MIRIYASTRAFPGFEENGDTWTQIETATGARIAVIDGAGHGPEAARASTEAVRTLQEGAALPLTEVLKRCHTALHGTRGAVLSVLQVQDNEIEFAGVGNVEARLIANGTAIHLPPARGLAGMVIPTVRPQHLSVSGPWVAVLFTDGISQRFLSMLPPLEHLDDPQAYVDKVVAHWGRSTDDATIVMVVEDGS